MATRVEGVDRLKKKLAAIPAHARKEIRAALETGAAEIAETARRFAPVDSGDLKASIGHTFGQYRAANANVRGVVSAADTGDPDLSVTIHAGDEKAWYAALVEFGSKGHPQGGQFAGTVHPGNAAQPYFVPAYRLLKKRVVSRITRATRKAARNVANSGTAA